MLVRAAPESYWKDLDAYQPAQVAAALRIPMLILHGDRDYQVTSVDLQGWRDALDRRTDVTIQSYPTLNHLFMAGEGKATPAEYERAGRVAEFVLDDIATWIGNASPKIRDRTSQSRRASCVLISACVSSSCRRPSHGRRGRRPN
jgi:dienelactone hydrolase